MGYYTLEQFSSECHRILAEDPGVEGRKKICALVKNVLKDEDFVAAHLHDGVPERKILYEDPKLGFCILGHVNHGARESKPHDHGPTWAIYGQARGETIMSDWALLEPASEEQPGRVRLVREYTLTPGDAYVYNEGDLHSPRREGSTRLIRIEAGTSKRFGGLPTRQCDEGAAAPPHNLDQDDGADGDPPRIMSTRRSWPGLPPLVVSPSPLTESEGRGTPSSTSVAATTLARFSESF